MTSPLPRLTLVLGGARSGKSRYGERLIASAPSPWTYIATAEAWDDEMRARIGTHVARRGAGWTTREVPLSLAQAINDTPAAAPVLVDCLTLWLSNVMLAGLSVDAEQASLCAALRAAAGPLVLISNEVGLGIVPETPLGREFRDAQGRLNAEVAAIADHVVFLAAGLPLVLKPEIDAMTDEKKPDDKGDDRHKQKMANRKAVQDAEVASKTTIEKGLLIVHTGKGKGKSTAAFGLLLRAIGRGFKAGVVQFGKGAWETGERAAISKFGDQVVWYTLGEGFTWETQDRTRDVAAAERAWEKAVELMADPEIRMLILDELNISLRYDHLDLAKVVAALAARRPDLHIVVTGRNAKPELIEAADLVTEMVPLKHHFDAGVRAQEGIEY